MSIISNISRADQYYPKEELAELPQIVSHVVAKHLDEARKLLASSSEIELGEGFLAAVTTDDPQMIALFTNPEVRIDKNLIGQAFARVVFFQNLPLTEMFLKTPHLYPSRYFTPISTAIQNQDIPILERLLSFFRVSREDLQIFLESAAETAAPLIDLFLEYSKTRQIPLNLSSALKIAVEKRNYSSIAKLFLTGTLYNQNEIESFMLQAVLNDDLLSVRILIEGNNAGNPCLLGNREFIEHLARYAATQDPVRGLQIRLEFLGSTFS